VVEQLRACGVTCEGHRAGRRQTLEQPSLCRWHLAHGYGSGQGKDDQRGGKRAKSRGFGEQKIFLGRCWAGSKLTKAQELGVTVLDEDAQEMLNDGA
jgi:hypothetical protein